MSNLPSLSGCAYRGARKTSRRKKGGIEEGPRGGGGQRQRLFQKIGKLKRRNLSRTVMKLTQAKVESPATDPTETHTFLCRLPGGGRKTQAGGAWSPSNVTIYDQRTQYSYASQLSTSSRSSRSIQTPPFTALKDRQNRAWEIARPEQIVETMCLSACLADSTQGVLLGIGIRSFLTYSSIMPLPYFFSPGFGFSRCA